MERYGHYVVTKHQYCYSVTREGQLVNEFKSHRQARSFAKGLSEAEQPTPTKTGLNDRLVAVYRKAGHSISDDYFMRWPASRIKKETVRMETALANGR